MVQYYAFPAPREDLYRDLAMEDITLPTARPFAEFRCAATKFDYGMSLDSVKEKIRAQWLKELKKPRNPAFGVDENEVTIALAQCVHAYVVLEDTAKMLLQLKKSFNLLDGDISERISYNYQLFAYLNMLICMRAEGTYVQILTDGKEHWLTHDDERLRDNAKWVDSQHTIYNRLLEKK